jgi:hypothetical protein
LCSYDDDLRVDDERSVHELHHFNVLLSVPNSVPNSVSNSVPNSNTVSDNLSDNGIMCRDLLQAGNPDSD